MATQIQTRMLPVVNAVPRAAYTWESRAILRGNQQQTPRIRMAFTRPICIVGAHVTIARLNPPDDVDFVEETVDTVDVLVEMDRGDRFTASDTEEQNATGQFVTLSSLDQVRAGRYLEWILDIPAPVLQITYAHQRSIDDWRFADSLVKLALFAAYLGE